MKTEIFGRINKAGNVEVLNSTTGEAITRLDANVYPVGSDLSAKYEHPKGIILTRADALRLNIDQRQDY